MTITRTELAFCAGMMAGAGLMFLMDPLSGRRRRNVALAGASRAARRVEEAAGAAARDLRNRSLGLAAELRHRVSHEEVDDSIVVERVRAAMGHVVTHPHGIEVACQDGCLTLSGKIAAEEHQGLIRKARSVPGVRGLVDHLQAEQAEAGQDEGRSPLFRMTPAGWMLTALGAGVLAGLGKAMNHEEPGAAPMEEPL